jgi:hypothetical protein
MTLGTLAISTSRCIVAAMTFTRTAATRLAAICSLVAIPAIQAQSSTDVSSAEAVVHAAYDVISGPAGQARDWNRFYALFAPGARLIPTRRDSTGAIRLSPVTPEEFAKQASDYFAKQPFYEKEIGRTSESFGAISQVFSAYASRHAPDDAKPFARGINSFQLFNDGHRWYIVTIYWDDEERSGQTIPSRYLSQAEARSK